MTFCNLSLGYKKINTTNIPNLFIEKYFNANTNLLDLAVYIYGIYLSQNNYCEGNNIDAIAEKLGIDRSLILKSFAYWEEEELVNIDPNENPKECPVINYRPIFLKSPHESKAYDLSRYSEFQNKLHDYYGEKGKLLNTNDLILLVDDMERWDIEKDAAVEILDYCFEIYGLTISITKIHSVLKDFGLTNSNTLTDAKKHIVCLKASKGEVGRIIKQLNPTLLYNIGDYEIELFNKWTSVYKFSNDAIFLASKYFKRKGTMTDLDEFLTELYQANVVTLDDIKSCIDVLESRLSLSKKIIQAIGSFDKYDTVAKTYVNSWMQKGFEDSALIEIARYCFASCYKTLDVMDQIVTKFHVDGNISVNAVRSYIKNLRKYDDEITKVLNVSSSNKTITDGMRSDYKLFVQDWKFNPELILFVAEQEKGKRDIFPYLNRTLGDMKNNNINNIVAARKYLDSLKTRSTFKKQQNASLSQVSANLDVNNKTVYRADTPLFDIEKANLTMTQDILDEANANRIPTVEDVQTYVSQSEKYGYGRPELLVAAEVLSKTVFSWEKMDLLLSNFKKWGVTDYYTAVDYIKYNSLDDILKQ